jgi:hypothetical protein
VRGATSWYPQALPPSCSSNSAAAPAVGGYFQRFKTTTDHQRAFIESFGMSRSTFERDLMRRWRQTVAQYRAR